MYSELTFYIGAFVTTGILIGSAFYAMLESSSSKRIQVLIVACFAAIWGLISNTASHMDAKSESDSTAKYRGIVAGTFNNTLITIDSINSTLRNTKSLLNDNDSILQKQNESAEQLNRQLLITRKTQNAVLQSSSNILTNVKEQFADSKRNMYETVTGTDTIPCFMFAVTFVNHRLKSIGALVNTARLPALEFSGHITNADLIEGCRASNTFIDSNFWVKQQCLDSITIPVNYIRILPATKSLPVELPLSDPYNPPSTIRLLCVLYYKGKRFEEQCFSKIINGGQSKFQAVRVKEYLGDKLLKTYVKKWSRGDMVIDWDKEFPLKSYNHMLHLPRD